MSSESIKKQPNVSARQRKELEQLAQDVVDEASEKVFKRMTIITYIVLGIAVVAVIALVFIGSRPAQPPQILTVDREGQVTPINAFERPPSSPNVLMSIGQRYVREMMNFNAINYNEKMAENRDIFISEKFFDAYVNSIESSSWFNSLMENKLSMTAIPNGIPVISNPSGSVGGAGDARYWIVKIPVELYLEGPGVRPVTFKRIFTVQLVHIKQHQYHAGIGVANLDASPAR